MADVLFLNWAFDGPEWRSSQWEDAGAQGCLRKFHSRQVALCCDVYPQGKNANSGGWFRDKPLEFDFPAVFGYGGKDGLSATGGAPASLRRHFSRVAFRAETT